MNKEELVQQLKSNWQKVLQTLHVHNPSNAFMPRYHCLENIGEIETGRTQKSMMGRLKKSDNELKRVFHEMLKNKDFQGRLQILAHHSPIKNKTTGEDVFLNNPTDFGEVMDIVYKPVRNNVMHGKGPLTHKEKGIVRTVNWILYKIVGGARHKYI